MRILVFALAVAGCSSDSTKTVDAPKAGVDSPAGTTLTIKNVFSWCSVTVAGGTASTAAVITTHVPPGQITLTAKGAGTFILGPDMWHHVDGTTGNTGVAGTVAGDTSTAKITVGATAACAWVCCPFPNGSGCATGAPDNLGDLCP